MTAYACYARHFDLLHKPSSTVPPYADELGLLVLATLLTSVSLSKKYFCLMRPYLWQKYEPFRLLFRRLPSGKKGSPHNREQCFLCLVIFLL